MRRFIRSVSGDDYNGELGYNPQHGGLIMKTLGLSFLLFAFILVPFSLAQDRSQNSQSSADDAIVQLWNAHSVSTDQGSLEGDKLIISSDSDLIRCLKLRVYREKRVSRKSDVTVPAGYTTCVPTNRMNVFKTGVYNPGSAPQQ